MTGTNHIAGWSRAFLYLSISYVSIYPYLNSYSLTYLNSYSLTS